MKVAALLTIGVVSLKGGQATTTVADSTTAACTGDAAIDCQCMYSGTTLATNIISQYPGSNPGMYASYRTIPMYGTTCAAWDQMPETPWYSYCNASTTTDWSVSGSNWCQAPWCYVSSCCSTYTSSSVFAPASFGYSYEACGAPNCYGSSFSSNSNCPYDPNSDSTYKVFKASCPCLYQGSLLPDSIYSNYPASNPGTHSGLASISSYGTTCAAWDSIPATPWFSYCPATADFCELSKNWCSAPWCYVDSSCSTFVSSSVFNGSPAAGYSYDTCGAPNCYTSGTSTDDVAATCPFDTTDMTWGYTMGTSGLCASGFTGLGFPTTTADAGGSSGNMDTSKASLGTSSGLAVAAALATASCMASERL